MAVSLEQLIVFGSPTGVIAINATTGAQKWVSRASGAVPGAVAVDVAGHIFAVGNQGVLVVR